MLLVCQTLSVYLHKFLSSVSSVLALGGYNEKVNT